VQSKDTLKKLDVLAEKIDVLTKLTAIGMQRETIFKGKKQKEQIKILAKMRIPRNLIALMVGTTPQTVSVTLSRMKSKKGKTRPKKTKQEAEVQQQP